MSYVQKIEDTLTAAGVPTHDDHGKPLDNVPLRVNVLAAERDDAVRECDYYHRLYKDAAADADRLRTEYDALADVLRDVAEGREDELIDEVRDDHGDDAANHMRRVLIDRAIARDLFSSPTEPKRGAS